MSSQLLTCVENARDQLAMLIPDYATGKISHFAHANAIGLLFRQIGVSSFLLSGTSEPLFVAQMQAASSYAFGLARVKDEDKVTSIAGCLWDAIAGEYWPAATAIARMSRASQNADREHEDDFLYVAFLIMRYLQDPSSRDQPARRAAQEQLLDRWQQVLDGALDPRLDVCRALLAKDSAAFSDGLEQTADARQREVEQKHKKGLIPDEQAAWFKFFWPEGLALIRFASGEGLALRDDYPLIPTVARARNAFAYDANAWRSLDYRPATNAPA